MDKEMIMALVGIGLTIVGLAVLAILQQSRMKRDKDEKTQSVRRSLASDADKPAGAIPFFIARYRGSKARFFRVYHDQGGLLFLNAGPFVVAIDAETPRGTDRRHWAAQSVKLVATALAVGAVGAIAAFVVIARAISRNPSHNPAAAGSILLGVLGVIGLLAAGLIIVVPLVVRRIMQRAAELDAMTLHQLREQAEIDELSFQCKGEQASGVKFDLLELGGPSKGISAVGATLRFIHKPTGKWTLETTTTQDTRDALDAFRKALGHDNVTVEAALEDRLQGRQTAGSAVRRKEIATSEPMPRGYGFPLAMLIGFAVGAAAAVTAAYLFSQGGRISFVTLVKFLFSLGGMGTYTGHVVAAAMNPEKGLKPFGLVPFGAWLIGGAIVFGGTIAILLAAWMIIGPAR